MRGTRLDSVKIVFAGTPDAAVPALDAFAASEHEIAAVLTRPNAPVGRKRVLRPSPVKARALELGLPVVEASRLRGEVISELRGLDVDAVAVVAYGAIAGPAALASARLGWFNLHFSLLPAYRGAAPIQRALMDDARVSGVTVFRIDTGMDTGPVLRQLELPLGHADAAAALADYARRGAAELVAAFDDLAHGRAAQTLQVGSPSRAEKITVVDAHLDFTRPAAEVLARSRGTSPAPGPWAEISGKRTKLFRLASLEMDAPFLAAAGVPVAGALRTVGDVAVLGCGDAWLSVQEIQPFGKSRMAVADFLRGHGDVQFDLPEPTEPTATTEQGA